jgi:hypothetical protein
MFSGSQYFTVAGGTFHNISNNYTTYTTAPTVPPGMLSHLSNDDLLNTKKTFDRSRWETYISKMR